MDSKSQPFMMNMHPFQSSEILCRKGAGGRGLTIICNFTYLRYSTSGNLIAAAEFEILTRKQAYHCGPEVFDRKMYPSLNQVRFFIPTYYSCVVIGMKRGSACISKRWLCFHEIIHHMMLTPRKHWTTVSLCSGSSAVHSDQTRNGTRTRDERFRIESLTHWAIGCGLKRMLKFTTGYCM